MEGHNLGGQDSKQLIIHVEYYPIKLIRNSGTCLDDCSGHGDCYEGTCHCHVGYTSENCNQSEYFCEYVLILVQLCVKMIAVTEGNVLIMKLACVMTLGAALIAAFVTSNSIIRLVCSQQSSPSCTISSCDPGDISSPAGIISYYGPSKQIPCWY